MRHQKTLSDSWQQHRVQAELERTHRAQSMHKYEPDVLVLENEQVQLSFAADTGGRYFFISDASQLFMELLIDGQHLDLELDLDVDKTIDELFPDWKAQGAPVKTAVTRDIVWYMTGEKSAIYTPGWMMPRLPGSWSLCVSMRGSAPSRNCVSYGRCRPTASSSP